MARSLAAGIPLIEASTSSIGWRLPATDASRASVLSRSARGSRGSRWRRSARRWRARPAPCARRAARGVGLDDVVDAGRPAAEVLIGRLDNLESRNPSECGAGGEGQPLCVAEMAGILERDGQRQRMAPRTRSRRRDELAHVNLAANSAARSSPEEPAELFEMGTAAGGVDDDEVDSSKCLDESARESLSLLEAAASVHGERAATTLRRRDDLEAVAAARTRAVASDHVGEDRLLHAPRKQADASTRLAGRVGGREFWNLAAPRQRGAISASGRKRFGMGRARPSGAAGARRACGRGRGGPGTGDHGEADRRTVAGLVLRSPRGSTR